ncbi:hypothetical protein ABCS02_12395 [Microbacterium sp. X-17]|uniref:hypothetical protein n=1 Tax=Microbacterium sp. X-17 TaxID=3144404 RepID=UPI0031F4909D
MSTSGHAEELERLRERLYRDDGRGLTAAELRRLESLERMEHPDPPAREAPLHRPDASARAAARRATTAPAALGRGEPAGETGPARRWRRARTAIAVGLAVVALLAAGVGLGNLWSSIREGAASDAASLPEFSTIRTDEDLIAPIPADLLQRIQPATVRYIALIDGVAVRLALSPDGEACLLANGRVPGGWALACGANGVVLDVATHHFAVRPVPADAEIIGWLSPSVALIAGG